VVVVVVVMKPVKGVELIVDFDLANDAYERPQSPLTTNQI
jgi:hypothetical protein